MASIKISNLPDLQSGSVSANDYFIVNDENQTTSKLKFTDFITALGSQNYVFSGDVSFTGELSVNIVDDTNSNVYTKTSVNTLIAESEARTLIPVTANATDISQLQNLLPAPTSGGLFLAGTFRGAASAATQVVTAVNAVSDKVELQVTELDTLKGFVNTLGSDLAAVTNTVSSNAAAIGLLQTAVGDAGSGLTLQVADNEAAITALDSKVQGDIDELADLNAVVDGIKASLESGGSIKNEIEAAQTTATDAGADADAAQASADKNRGDTRGALAALSLGITTLVSNNNTITANELASELVSLINIELAAGGNLQN